MTVDAYTRLATQTVYSLRFKMQPLTEDQVIKIILSAVEKNFPKDCTCCKHRFHTYKEYLQGTYPLGTPHSYDAELENWRPQKSMGFLAYWTCKYCNNTMTTNINSLEKDTVWQLLQWIKGETKHSGVSSRALLNDIRNKMRRQVLSE